MEKRAICLAVTADDRDQGHPTAWSAAIDQLCSGATDDERRLVVVSAGNVDLQKQIEYPQANRERGGIEDPAQSWNALTVAPSLRKCISGSLTTMAGGRSQITVD